MQIYAFGFSNIFYLIVQKNKNKLLEIKEKVSNQRHSTADAIKFFFKLKFYLKKIIYFYFKFLVMFKKNLKTLFNKLEISI